MSSAQELEFAPSLEIELEVRDNVNSMLMLKDPELQKHYEEFIGGRQSLSGILGLIVVFIICTIPMSILTIGSIFHQSDVLGYFNCALVMTVLICVNGMLWAAYISEKQKLIKEGTPALALTSRKNLRDIQMRVFVIVQLVACYRLLGKVIKGACDGNNTLLGTFGCNPSHELGEVPPETCMVCMVIPMVFCMAVHGSHFEFSLFLWVAAMLSIVAAMVYLGSAHSLIFVLIFSLGSLLVLIESRKSSYFLFFMHRKLQQILLMRQKEADEENAAEMRHMIANVAHDLKTPLTSFLGGLDFITHAIREASQLRWTHGTLSVEDLDDLVQSVSQCITNMRNTNSFMLMTINRCIDYTKASKGVRLVPKLETVDLLEALSLPLNCMKDIQQRVSIVLEAASKDICSHIITDKQWLQENVLCLLSNAVKYSHEGEVHIRVSRYVAMEDEVMHSPTNSFHADNRVGSSTSLFSLQSFRMESAPRYLAMCPPLGTPSASWLGMSYASSRDLHSRSDSVSTAPSSVRFPSLPVPARRSLSSSSGQREYLRVEVEDHGIGLSDEVIRTLFSPFRQAQRLAGGTGLGLFSLAKRIEALEGQCGVERRRDGHEGSLFWFLIPYRPDEPAAASAASAVSAAFVAAAVNPAANGPPLASLGRTETEMGRVCTANTSWLEASLAEKDAGPLLDVLVVEDSPTVLKMTSMMLHKHKHVVTTAVNGAEAVKRVSERLDKFGNCFDVVLMDLQMPVMDGLEATKRLRRLEQEWNCGLDASAATEAKRLPLKLKIVGVSANSDSSTEVAAFQVGFDAFIPKPFSLDTFYATFHAVQDKS